MSRRKEGRKKKACLDILNGKGKSGLIIGENRGVSSRNVKL